MAITFGGSRSDRSDIESFAKEVEREMLTQIGERTLALSGGRLRKLQEAVKLAVYKEAFYMFDKAIQVIEKSRSRALGSVMLGGGEVIGFRASDLGSGTAVGRFGGSVPFGEIIWPDLSPKWAAHKLKTQPTVANRFFQYSGRLVSQLENRGYQVGRIANMGGVSVSLKPGRVIDERKLTRGDPRMILANIEINIFPSLNASILPMLASKRWTDTNEGAFESKVFGGMTGKKLTGPEDRHRPLFQPLTQFWIAYRIPVAVRYAINRTLRNKS